MMNAEKTTAPASIPITKKPDLMFPSEVMTSCLSGHPPRRVPMIPTKIPPTNMQMMVAATESPPGAPGIAARIPPGFSMSQKKFGNAEGTRREKTK